MMLLVVSSGAVTISLSPTIAARLTAVVDELGYVAPVATDCVL